MTNEQACELMVDEQIIKRGIKDNLVIKAMKQVPRHLFVEHALRNRAYDDHALPISEGQTISQPFMVAKMTEILELKGDERVLEIGTGSGYQAAVLSRICEKVYTIERIKSLSVRARAVFDDLGYINIVTKIFDGTYGWISESPFDRIIVTAYSPNLPDLLSSQLKVGGIMVIPVGVEGIQQLTKITRTEDSFESEDVLSCTFVKLVGEYGWKE